KRLDLVLDAPPARGTGSAGTETGHPGEASEPPPRPWRRAGGPPGGADPVPRGRESPAPTGQGDNALHECWPPPAGRLPRRPGQGRSPPAMLPVVEVRSGRASGHSGEGPPPCARPGRPHRPRRRSHEAGSPP